MERVECTLHVIGLINVTEQDERKVQPRLVISLAVIKLYLVQ